MADREYEFTFEVAGLTDEVEDAIVEQTDATIATFGAVTTVTMTSFGTTGFGAATNARLAVEGAGGTVLRCVEDLVTRGDIAERTGMTRQAVSNWVRGERQATTPFPSPYVLAGGGLWLWGEVLEWLREVHPTTFAAVGDDLAYPTRADHACIAGQIESSRRAFAMAELQPVGQKFEVHMGSAAVQEPIAGADRVFAKIGAAA